MADYPVPTHGIGQAGFRFGGLVDLFCVFFVVRAGGQSRPGKKRGERNQG